MNPIQPAGWFRVAVGGLALILLAPAAFAQVSSQFTFTNITTSTATVTLSGHSGAWYLGVETRSGTAVSCTAQSGNTSANLADLTASTTYDLTAWNSSFSSCSGPASGTITTGSFTTQSGPSLAASNVTHNSATLTITSHSDAWYYKYTVPSTPPDTCSTVVAAGTSTASLSNLTSATSYTYKAYSDTSCSAELTSASNDADFTTKPGQVTGVSVTAGPAKLDVSWTALSGTVTGYKVQWKKSNEGYTSARTKTVTGGASTSTSILDLTANTEYTVRVMAYNGTGDGAVSSEATGTPKLPVGFSVTDVGANSATVTLNSYSGNWRLRLLKNGVTQSCKLQSGNTVKLTGLQPQTSYRVIAYAEQYSDCAGLATPTLATANFTTPHQPALTASAVTHNSATLTITHHTGDWYYKYTTPTTPAGTCSAVVSAGTDTASLASLTAGTTYTYKAYSDTSCTEELTSSSTDAEFLTKPSQVTGVTVTAGNARLDVSWTAVSGTVAGYKVQWKKSSERYNSTRQNTVTSGTSSIIRGVANGTAYTVRVTAYNATGDGAASSGAGTPVGGAVTLTASSVEDASATLTISNHTGDWHYKYTAPLTPADTCSSVVSAGTSTASLATLSRATNYTYKAYSDAQCTAELTSASTDADFLTKPGRVTGVTVTPGDTTLSVGWTAVSGTLSGYKVQWKKGDESYDSTRTNTVASGTTSNTITGLTNNAAYTVRVTAYNATGDGAASSEVTATPAAPAATLTASAVEASTATLTIANHSGDWYYKYTAPTTPAGTCSTVVSSGTDTASLASLLAGTNYTFKAYSDVSCNTELTSAATDADFLTKPGQVMGVTATGAKEALSVSWTATTGATGYTVQWKGDGESYDTSRQATPTSNSHKITGLTDAANYSIRVHASNGTGDGAWSADATGTPAASKVPYPTLTLTGGTRRLTASWTHPLPSTTGLTFRVRYRKAGTSAWTFVDASSNSGKQNFGNATTSATIPGHEGGTLDDNANYEVGIRGGKWNQGFSGWGPWSGTKTKPTLPGAPTKPTVTVANLGSGRVQVASSVPGSAKITGWEYKTRENGITDGDWTEISSSSSSLSHIVTGLTNGSRYNLKVRAMNVSGEGAESPQSEMVIPLGASLTASAITDDTATLTIGNHTGNWWYKRTTPPGGQCSTTVSGTTANLSGLSTGAAHTFKAYSDSRCTAELASESFTTKPAQVTGLSLTASSATLEANWNAVTGATRYTIQWKTSDQQYQSSRQATPTSNSYTVSGLTNGTQYRVRVRATGGGGDGAWSSEATGTPGVPQPVLSATNVTTTGATFSLSNRTGTWYLKGGASSGASGATVANCVAVAGGSLSSYTLANLTEYTTYTFTAYGAPDCAEASKLKSLTFRTASRLAKVTGLTATAGSDSSIDLSWAAVSGVTSYKVQYKSGAQDWSSTLQWVVYTNSQNVPNNSVDANVAYTFRVAATDAIGDGPWSDEVVATPVEVTLTASGVGADSATLTIANRTGTWYYKQTAPTAGTCSSGVATASTSVSGLTPGRTHTFNAYKDDQCTGEVLATTPQFLTKPGKAAGVAATAAATALGVSWTATTGASSYKIQWKSGSDDWDATNRQATSTTASATISSLTNGTTYTVRVAAVNDTGDGAWSDTATGTPSGSSLREVTPAANGGVFAIQGHTGTWYSKIIPPANATCETNASNGKIVADKSSGTDYTITAYSDSNCAIKLTSLDFTTLPAKVAGVAATARVMSLALNWTAETGTAATSYKVQWKSGAENWDATSRQVVTTKTSVVLSDLTNDTQYTIRVAATTTGGDGAWSDNATGTPSATAVTLALVGVTDQSGVVNLKNHTGNWWYSSTAGSFPGQCHSGPSGGTVSVPTNSGTENTVTAYSDGACSTELSSIDFLTLPGKTADVSLMNGGGSLRVSWTDEVGATSYKVQWKSVNESFGSTREITSANTPATIPSLTNNTAYSVRVAAVNASGDGAWSDTVTATPTVLLIGSNLTSTGVTLTVAGWGGNWFLAGRGSGGYSLACTQISGTTHSPALSGNTTYEYKAYDTDRCTGRALASTSFTTPGAVTLEANNIGQHSVALYLDGWRSLPIVNISSIVHEAGSSNPVARCRSFRNPAFAAHNNYGSLKADTTYTAQYFRGARCEAIERLTSVTFTTLSTGAEPELSISNVTDTGATLTISNHTGNWWYEDNDVADSCIAVTGGATAVHLSGLTANTNYGFTAWSHEGCADSGEVSMWYSRKFFTTTGPLTVSVSDKTSTGLTVNLRGYTEANGYPDQWSVRVIEPNGRGGYTGPACQTLPRATTSATVTGLEAGKQYTIQINKNNHCVSFGSVVNETPVTMVSLVGGSVGPSSASLTLEHHEGAWSYQGGENAGDASGASAQATAENDATGQCQAMPAGQTTANLTGLKSDTSYTYTAYDGSDCSGLELAQAAFATTPAPAPAAPSGLSAVAGDASVTLTWSDPSDPSITGYAYQVNHDDTDTGNLTGWGSWMAIDGSGADTTSHVVSGLTNGREYRFRLRAENDAGTSANAPEADPWYVSAIPQAADKPAAPEVPSSVSVTRADGALHVSWPAVEGATSYHITYSSDDGASWSLAAEHHPENSIAITGVDNALTYIVGVRARNEGGDSGWINSPSAGPYAAGPPDAVGSVTVNRGDGALHASWPGAAGATSYHVTYTSDNGASWSLAALHHPETSITITGVDNALTYIVGVRARNQHGDSGWINSSPAGPYTGAGIGLGEEPSDGVAGAKSLEIEPDDLAPDFGTARIADLLLKTNQAVAPLALPEATGGDGELTYALSPELPAGLRFDPATRVLSGAPTQPAAERTFEYTATDSDATEPDMAMLTFTIEVPDLAPDFGAARIPDLHLEANEAMEPLALPEATGGDGALTYALGPELPAGLSFDSATRVLSGLPTQPAVARSFEYTATDSDLSGPDVAVLTFRIGVEVSSADRAVLNEALAAQGRAFLTSATSAIGERFRAPTDAPTGALAATPQANCPEGRDSDGPGAGCATASGHAATALNAFANMLASYAGGASPMGGAWGDGHPAGGMMGGADTFSAGALAPSAGGGGGIGFGHAGTFGQAGSFDTAESFGQNGSFGAGGSFGAAALAEPSLHTAEQPDWNLGQMLQGRSFTMPLYEADDADGYDGDTATQRRWTLWGAVDAQTFNNPAEAGRYDGDVTSMFMGVDRRFGDGNWLGGAALSASKGKTNYAAQGREGRLDTKLAGFHPYVWTQLAWGLEWWLIGGIGTGEATDLRDPVAPTADQTAPASATAETADLQMRMAATGLRLPLRQRGAVEFALVGGIGMLTLSTDDKDRALSAVSGLEADVSQGRLGIEVSRTGNGILPYLRLGARSDGGDGVTGTGLEAVAGVRYGGARVDFEAQLRWLGAHSKDEYKDYEEYGGMARLTVKAREDGSGLRLTLAPTWGQAGMGGAGMAGASLGGGGLLGGPGLGAMPMAGGMAGGPAHGAFADLGALSLESEFGYGFASNRGLLTLGGTHRRNGSMVSETVGLTWTSGGTDSASMGGQGLNFRLGYELPTPTLEGAPYLELTYTNRF